MTRISLILAACVASQLGFVVPALAQSRDLLAGVPAELGALPRRVRKSAAPGVSQTVELEALRNESHPALGRTLLVGEDVLRLVGTGFGREAAGREIHARVGTHKVALRVLSWREDEIRVQLPGLTGLGVDAKMAASFEREFAAGKKRVLGPDVEIGITLEGRWVAQRSAQLAVAYRDLDGDGSAATADCDDFDPHRYPGNQEIYDSAGFDEDCNEKTQAARPAPPVEPSAPPAEVPAATDDVKARDPLN